MLTKEEIIQAVTDADIFKSKLFTHVWLVGSFARDEATEKSDIDFLIDYDISEIENNPLTDWARALDFIENTFHCRAQFIPSEAYVGFRNSRAISIK